MFTKAITIQIAAALFAVAVAATPALARGGGGDAGSSAGSSAGSNSGGGDAGRSGGFSSGGGSERGAAPSAPSGARANSQRYGNVVDRHATSGVSHHGHGHHGRHAGNGFSFFDFSPGYASYSYDESPRCYRRHVRVHHHWVWRQYCRY